MQFDSTPYSGCNYLSMLGVKVIHVSKGDPGRRLSQYFISYDTFYHVTENTDASSKWDVKLLTHWGRVTYICVGILTIIGSDNGLSDGDKPLSEPMMVNLPTHICVTRPQWTNAGILLIEPLGTNFSQILIGIQILSFTKIRLKMSSGKCRPSCLGLNVLIAILYHMGGWPSGSCANKI